MNKGKELVSRYLPAYHFHLFILILLFPLSLSHSQHDTVMIFGYIRL